MEFFRDLLTPECLISAGLTMVLLSILSYVRVLSFQMRVLVSSQSDCLSKMSDNVSEMTEIFRKLYSKTEWIGDKVSYIELKVGRLLSTVKDSALALSEVLFKFDVLLSNGQWIILSGWVAHERDHWLRRHSVASWLVLTEAVQLSVISDMVYMRIQHLSKGGRSTAEELLRLENLISVVSENLRYLSKVSTAGQWRTLSTTTPQDASEAPSALQEAEYVVFEYFLSVGLHFERVAEMAKDSGVSWDKAMRGLSLRELFRH
jgi:hypothetical protein